jgi:hypothetical protein
VPIKGKKKGETDNFTRNFLLDIGIIICCVFFIGRYESSNQKNSKVEATLQKDKRVVNKIKLKQKTSYKEVDGIRDVSMYGGK